MDTPAPPGSPPPRPSELRRTARTGRVGNDAYLALPAPTAAQTREQVRALTEQVQALSRLVVPL